MLLPGIRSRAAEPDEDSQPSIAKKVGAKTPKTLQREMLEDLVGLIEKNGMDLLAAGGNSERTGPGWNAAAIIGDGAEGTLWLGDADDALNFEALRERGVTAVINCSLGDCKQSQAFCHSMNQHCSEEVTDEDKPWATVRFDADYYQQQLGCDDFWYLALNIEDTPSYPIFDHFDEIVDFLSRCREAKRSALVHCMMGFNRAGTACTVFLMREGISTEAEGLDLRDAVDWLSSRRAGVLQNEGFLKQMAIHGNLCDKSDKFLTDLVD